MSLRTDRVRITGSFKRKEGVSKEEFDNFWLNEHPKLFNSLDIVKGKILKYEQVSRFPTWFRKMALMPICNRLMLMRW